MRCLVISEQNTTGAALRDVLARLGQDCPLANVVGLDRARSGLAEVQPELVAVALARDAERGLAVLADLRDRTEAHLLAIGPVGDARQVLRAMRQGAYDYVDQANLDVELAKVLERIQTELDDQAPPAHMVAVLGTSGGSGASTIAVNVAAALAAEHKNTLLIDLKLETGDLAALLDLRPNHTLADLCQNGTRIDRSMVERSLERHSCGVALLGSPRQQVSALHQAGAVATLADRRVTPDGVRQTIHLARTMFADVVADVAPSFREEQVHFLRQADVILLALRLDFTSLRNTRRLLEHLDLFGLGRERVRLVVNRCGQSSEIPADKAEEALKMKLFHRVPDDPATINQANNYGLPAVLCAARSRVARSLCELARKVRRQA